MMNHLIKTGCVVAMMAGLAGTSVWGQTGAPPPASPPTAPPAGESEGIRIYQRPSPTRLRVRTVEYEGALVRIAQRARRHERIKKTEEAKWREGVENVSVDSLTGRPYGVNFFVIKF